MAEGSKSGPSLSLQWIRDALNSNLSSTLKLVTIAFVSHANDKHGGRMWPGLERICWLTNYSLPCVKRALRQLKDQQALLPFDDAGSGFGAGNRLVFTFDPTKLPWREPYKRGAVFRRKKGSQGTLFLPEEGVTSNPFKGQRQTLEGATSDQEGATSDPQKGNVGSPELVLKGDLKEDLGLRGAAYASQEHQRVAPDDARNNTKPQNKPTDADASEDLPQPRNYPSSAEVLEAHRIAAAHGCDISEARAIAARERLQIDMRQLKAEADAVAAEIRARRKAGSR